MRTMSPPPRPHRRLRRSPLRRLSRLLLVPVALVLLLEAWLWERLRPLIARVVDLIAWPRLRAAIAALIEPLPPPATLVVFLVPVAVLFPLKLAGLWLLAHGRWVEAGLTLLAAKLLGVGVTAFVFDLTRDKLLRMGWFAQLHDWTLRAVAWAHRLTDPVKARIRAVMRLVLPHRAGRTWRLLRRIRRRMRTA